MSLLLFSRKPLSTRPLHEWLCDAGRPLCLVTTKSGWAHRPPGAEQRFHEVVTVEDYRSWEVELRAGELAGRCRTSLIASSSEDDVVRAARLRDRLGLPGQSLRSACAYRDKVTMKQHAVAAGVATPRFSPVDSPHDLLGFIDDTGYPVVVKPRRGVGSTGVHVVPDANALNAVLAAGFLPASPSRTGSWMVEEFIAAPFFHVDGIAVDGQVLHCWPSRYSSGNMIATRNRAPLSSTMLDAAAAERCRLQEFAAQVVAALPAIPLPTTFHLEAWLPPDRQPVLCEIACRTGGASVAEVYRRAFGMLLPQENFRGQCGLPAAAPSAGLPIVPRKSLGWIALTPNIGTFCPPAQPCPVSGVDFEFQMAAGTQGPAATHAGDSAASAVVEGADQAEVESRIAAVVEWWTASEPWR